MTKSLFEISQDLHRLEEALDAAEDDESMMQLIVEWFESAVEQRDQKLDNYAELISSIENRIAVRQAEAKRILELAESDRKKVYELKERLRCVFASHGWGKVETPRYRLSLVQNGGKAPLIVDIPTEELPTEFVEIRQTLAARNDLIREHLESGKELNFARIGERGSHIRIK
jgi:hypothetical protein